MATLESNTISFDLAPPQTGIAFDPSMATLESNTISFDLIPSSTAAVKTSKKQRRPRAAQKVEAQNTHFHLVLEAAQTVNLILSQHDYSCAVFGSLAAKLYGAPRVPKDVDLLVSQELAESESEESSSSGKQRQRKRLSAQELKDLILRANSRNFYLKMPRDPAAEYRILWYRQYYRGPECKVDIVIPGTMCLPFLHAHRVLFINNIPIVPFSLLLMHKLQGWDDHCKAEEAYKKRKRYQDAADIKRLLGLKQEMGLLRRAKPWDDEELFDEEFLAISKERVKAYCEMFPDRADEWKEIGFDIS